MRCGRDEGQLPNHPCSGGRLTPAKLRFPRAYFCRHSAFGLLQSVQTDLRMSARCAAGLSGCAPCRLRRHGHSASIPHVFAPATLRTSIASGRVGQGPSPPRCAWRPFNTAEPAMPARSGPGLTCANGCADDAHPESADGAADYRDGARRQPSTEPSTPSEPTGMPGMTRPPGLRLLAQRALKVSCQAWSQGALVQETSGAGLTCPLNGRPSVVGAAVVSCNIRCYPAQPPALEFKRALRSAGDSFSNSLTTCWRVFPGPASSAGTE